MRIDRRLAKKGRKPLFVATVALIVSGAVAFAIYMYTTQTTVAPPPAVSMIDVPKEAGQPSGDTFQQQPAHISIPALSIEAPIIPVGLTSDGLMGAPQTLHEVGWYNKSAVLGSDSGYSVLMDGHYGTDADRGIFYSLHTIGLGDDIIMTGEEGSEATFKVVEITRDRIEAIDMKKALYVYPGASQSITLITCEGLYDSARATYNDRIVVYAVRV
ncbi:MAG TPA: class F sortase [Candidatus Saccharibacteria bacterium]|nr:class F sortase [Candidatus Saccharibacteria bacterium]